MKLSLLGIFIFIASYAYGDVGKFDIADSTIKRGVKQTV